MSTSSWALGRPREGRGSPPGLQGRGRGRAKGGSHLGLAWFFPWQPQGGALCPLGIHSRAGGCLLSLPENSSSLFFFFSLVLFLSLPFSLSLAAPAACGRSWAREDPSPSCALKLSCQILQPPVTGQGSNTQRPEPGRCCSWVLHPLCHSRNSQNSFSSELLSPLPSSPPGAVLEHLEAWAGQLPLLTGR